MPLTYSWTDIADADIDSESPITSTLITALRNNIITVDEQVSYGYTRASAHAHNGTDSAPITPQHGHNLLLHSGPTSTNNNAGHWSTSGVTNDRDNGYSMSSSGSYFSQKVPAGANNLAATMKQVWGSNGCNFVGSLYAKSAAALTSGNVRFGLCDGNDGTAFITGARVTIDYTDLSTTWKRFWFTMSAVAGSLTTDLRCVGRVNSAMSATCYFGGFMLYPGSILIPYMPCPVDEEHTEFLQHAYSIPFWDWTISMTSATKLTAV